MVGRAFARALRQEYAGMIHDVTIIVLSHLKSYVVTFFFLFSDYVIVNLIYQVLHLDTLMLVIQICQNDKLAQVAALCKIIFAFTFVWVV